MSTACGKIVRRAGLFAVVALALACGRTVRAEGPPLVVGVDGTFAPHALAVR